jgi:CTP-dependent riboflavin kinase
MAILYLFPAAKGKQICLSSKINNAQGAILIPAKTQRERKTGVAIISLCP